MAGDQNIGGVYFQARVANSSVEQRTIRNKRGEIEPYALYCVWLEDGTKLEYMGEQNGASVRKENSGEIIFSGLKGGHIIDTPLNDRYTLEGCQGTMIEARRSEKGFFHSSGADSDHINVKDKINSNGTIIESKDNQFLLNKGDFLQLQEDFTPIILQDDTRSYTSQEKKRRARNIFSNK